MRSSKGRFSVRYENGDHTPREIHELAKAKRVIKEFVPYLGYAMDDFQHKDQTAYYTLDTMEINSVEKGIITRAGVAIEGRGKAAATPIEQALRGCALDEEEMRDRLLGLSLPGDESAARQIAAWIANV